MREFSEKEYAMLNYFIDWTYECGRQKIFGHQKIVDETKLREEIDFEYEHAKHLSKEQHAFLSTPEALDHLRNVFERLAELGEMRWFPETKHALTRRKYELTGRKHALMRSRYALRG